MKKILSIILALCMIFSMFTAIPAVAVEDEETTVSTALGDYYKFTFGEDGDRYNYTVANKTIGDTTGQATFKENAFYPLLVENVDASKGSADYKTITTPNGETYDVLEVKLSNNGYLVPLTKDGTPFEMVPGVKYNVNVKFFNPVCNTWGQMMIAAGGLNDKVANYSKKVNGVTWSNGEATVKNNVSVCAPFRAYGNGIVAGNAYAAFLKEGSYGTANITASCICEQYSTEEKPLECTHSSKYVTPYREVSDIIGVPEANGVYNKEKNSYSTKYSYVDETPDDASDDVYVEGNNYFAFTLSGGKVSTYKTYPIYSNATAEEITAAGEESTWQIVSIEIASENFKSSLSYSANGEVIETVKGDVGLALETVVPTIPEGKLFAGWYVDEAFTVPFTSETLEYGTNTVYAKFFDYGESVEIDFEDGTYPSTARYYDEAGTTWPLTGWSYRGNYYNSASYTGELAANLERNGLSTEFPESAVAFYSDRTWGQPGGLVFTNPDGTLFVPKAGEVYSITYKYRAPLNNGNKMSINVAYGLLDSMGNKTSSGDKQFSKRILAYNEIKEVVADWTEKTVTVTIPEEGEGYVPALGLGIDAVKKVAVNPDDATAGYNFTLIELDYVKVERVPTADVTFVAEDGTETTSKFAIGAEIQYPALKATNNGDAVWSLSKDEYVAVPEVLAEDVTVYAIVNPVIGFENYYSTQYANQSLDITVTDEFSFDGDKAAKLELRGYSYLTSAPTDWETDWTKYFFIEEDGTATPLTGDAAPEFEKFKYGHSRKGAQEHSFALWNLPGGSYYKVSFKYYVPAELTTDIKMLPYTNMYNLWSPTDVIRYNDAAIIIPATTETGKWLDGSIIFKNTATESKDFFYIHTFGVDTKDSGDVIYFDNFTYEVLENVGNVEFVNGEAVTKVFYEKDQAIEYPALAGAKGYDTYWSLSADSYVAVPKTFGGEDITVYAVKDTVIGFNNYVGHNYSSNTNLNVTDELEEGNKVLKVQDNDYTVITAAQALKEVTIGEGEEATTTIAWLNEKDSNTFWKHKFMLNEEGEWVKLSDAFEEAPEFEEGKYYSNRNNYMDHAVSLWKLELGKSYKVSFKYYLPAALTEEYKVLPITSYYENIWYAGKYVSYTNNAFVIGTDATVGEWVEGEVYFTNQATADSYSWLFMSLYQAGLEVGDVVYFDDFALTEVKYATFTIPEDATFEQGGILNGNVVTVYAELDEEIVAPLVIDAEGNPIEIWADENGNKVTEFVNGGAYKAASKFIYGDCNDDGKIDTTDLAVLKLNLANLGEVGLGGDCNADGKIDTTDLAVLKLFLAGLGELGAQ